MPFIDEVTVTVRSGAGGNGVVAWRREKHVPRGGPAGGNGGKGGDVVMVADQQLGTLLDFRYRKLIKAGRGGHGSGARRTGAAGADAIVRVPVGTTVTDVTTGEVLADLVSPGQTFVAARGGKGGRGNAAFTTSTNQAPDYAEPGEPGSERILRLTLKLLADVGIIGLPNAGKSTLISRISNARPKIAEYPFTTLVPNLGVVGVDDEGSFVIADVPGLIAGAAQGVGLGTRFLRHVERTALFLFLLAPMPSDEDPDPLEAIDILRHELAAHDPGLAQRPFMVALNKIDLPEGRSWIEPVREWCEARGVGFHPISAVTGEGLRGLILALWREIRRRKTYPPPP